MKYVLFLLNYSIILLTLKTNYPNYPNYQYYLTVFLDENVVFISESAVS
jgi:hypothetical protein